MFDFLKSHPFAVEAFFDYSIVFGFSLPKSQLQNHIPPCLELDTFDDKWAFVAAAMVQTKGLRPKGFPPFLGSDFFLIGYRIFVRYTNRDGKRVRGLYIIRSETDSRKMEFSGNIFTHYNYQLTDISVERKDFQTTIKSIKSNIDVTVDESGGDIPLPVHSPFADWKQARRFAGPMPFTFAFDSARSEVLIVEGVRQKWSPVPIKVIAGTFAFPEVLNMDGIVLANAFILRDIPYWWKKGRREKWSA